MDLVVRTIVGEVEAGGLNGERVAYMNEPNGQDEGHADGEIQKGVELHLLRWRYWWLSVNGGKNEEFKRKLV